MEIETADARNERLWQKYLSLLEKQPTLRLSSYLRMARIGLRGFEKWMRSRGYYLAGDETYHRVLVKVPGGRNSKKGYIWVVTAVHTGLVYYFYHDGSRAQDVILNYIGDYGGTFQSDGFSPYRKMAKMLTRLACLQAQQRQFLRVYL